MNKNRRTKLSEQQKSEIIEKRQQYNLSYPQLAAEYDVSPHTILRICNPDQYERQKQSNRNYYKQNKVKISEKQKGTRRRYQIAFHIENDAEIINYLDKQESVQDYVRQCVVQSILTSSNDSNTAEENTSRGEESTEKP